MEINEKEYINTALCIECGGICCKKSGCSYLPEDFENMNFETLKKEIDKGDISITSILYMYQNKKGQVSSANPVLALRVRNTGREIVDLLSKKTACSVLTDKGCPYSIEERPSVGVGLIPKKRDCQNIYTNKYQIEKWSNYQKVLQKLVRHYCGLSAEDKLKEDIINISAEIYIELKKAKKRDDISEETNDIIKCLGILKDLYKKEISEGQIKGEDEYQKSILKI